MRDYPLSYLITYLLVAVTAIGLWGVNIYKAWEMPAELTAKLILRIVGVFVFPVGVILGLV